MLFFLFCRQSPPPSPRRSINNLGFHLKFIVPNSITGAIMGKGGENVTRIHNATGAFIQASRAGSAVLSPRDRMITVAGDNAKSVKDAVRLLLLTLKELNVSDRLERTGYPIGRLFLKQVIPAPCAGKVLGPGGDQIQSINMSTGASVVIEAKISNAAFIPFRYVNYMSPNIEKLIDAVDMVTNLLNEDERYVPGIREITSVAFKVLQIPEKRAGSLLGPGGTYIQTLQDVLRVKLGICEGHKPGSRFVAVWGSPMNVNVALDVIAVATGGTPRGAVEMMKEDSKISDYHHDEISNDTGSGSESGDGVGNDDAPKRQQQETNYSSKKSSTTNSNGAPPRI
jgi:transcription antitermination factor NusA-like protein